ncbi:MAG: polysaccharide biosynthesis tyrosine autokinase [Elainellaceae cyanobacterium]
MNLATLAQIVQRRKVLIGGVALTATAAVWGWTLTRTAIYQGNFRVLVEPVRATDRSQPETPEEPAPAQPTVDYDTHVEVLQSPALLEPIVQDLRETYPDLRSEYLAENLAIARLDNTKVLEIRYQDTDPQRVQAVLEAAAQQVLDYSFEQRQANLQQGIQFVEEKLPELQEDVDRLQGRLERFRQQYGLFSPETRGADLSTLISSVEEQRQTLQTQLSQARSLLQALQSQLATTPEEALAATALSESTRYQALLNQVQELEAQIALESARYQPTTPQIAALRERRDNILPLLEAEAAKILDNRLNLRSGDLVDGNLTPTTIDLSRQLIEAANQVQMLQARSQTLAQVEQDLRQEFSLVPSLAREYEELQRQLTLATESLNRFLETRETLQIDAAQQAVPWRLIADPTTAQRPISPNAPRNLTLGAIAGLLLGVAVALTAEKLDQVFHSPEDLKTASPLPLLGTIPYLPNLPEQTGLLQRQSDRNGSSPRAPSSQGSHRQRTTIHTAMFLEAFRSLYTNVRFLGAATPIRSLVISSAIPEEGKSVTALYLAKAAALMGQRVLLVDADLRSPKHHSRLRLQNGHGLSTVVAQGLRIEDAVQRSSLDENLWVLTAGPLPSDPVKLLSSKRMQVVMQQVQDQYDLVIYDTPSVIGFADSSLLATHTDGLIMVVGLGKTERTALAGALDELKLAPGVVLGMVANGVRAYTSRIHGYHRYYRNYQQPSSAAPAAGGELVPAGADAPIAEQPAAASRPNGTSSHPVGRTSIPVADWSPKASAAPFLKRGDRPDAPSGFAPLVEPAPPDMGGVEPTDPVVATIGQDPTALKLKLAIAALGLALFAGGGWLLYTRFILSPPPLSEPSEAAAAPDASPDPSPNPDNAPTAPPADVPPENSAAPAPRAASPEARDRPQPPAPGIAPPEALPPERPAADLSNPFAAAERLAESALQAEGTAQTAQEWARIADQWQQAAALMVQVSGHDEQSKTARDRAVRYRQNGELARQKVLELLRSDPESQPQS